MGYGGLEVYSVGCLPWFSASCGKATRDGQAEKRNSGKGTFHTSEEYTLHSNAGASGGAFERPSGRTANLPMADRSLGENHSFSLILSATYASQRVHPLSKHIWRRKRLLSLPALRHHHGAGIPGLL